MGIILRLTLAKELYHKNPVVFEHDDIDEHNDIDEHDEIDDLVNSLLQLTLFFLLHPSPSFCLFH